MSRILQTIWILIKIIDRVHNKLPDLIISYSQGVYYVLDQYIKQCNSLFDKEYADILISLYDRFSKNAKSIEWARNRIVFIKDSYVIKLPLAEEGLIDNDWEGSVSDSGETLARTRLIYYKNIPIVFMEYIEHASDNLIKEKEGHIPDWTYSIDSGQVGYNKHGKLLAYDYGRC